MPSDAIQRIINADEDAISFSGFMVEPSDELIPRRLAPPMNTLNYYRDFLHGLELVYSQQSGYVDVNGIRTKTVTQALDDALDAAVIGGGGLAATAVATLSQASGALARTQASKNGDILSIKEFGNFADGADWTSAFHKAAATGKPIYLPDGNYKIRSDNFNCQGKDFIFYSENAVVTIIAGTNQYAFDVSNCPNVVLRGIHFTNTSTSYLDARYLMTVSPTSLIDNFSVTRCKFSNSITLIRATGSYTVDPKQNFYGFRKITYSDNKCENIYKAHIYLVNYPALDVEFNRNEINNFSQIFFGLVITNSTTGTGGNGDAVQSLINVRASNNTVVNADSYFNLDNNGAYHCVLLVEGLSVEWSYNKVSGLKSYQVDIELYDAYLNCYSVVSKYNTWRNNAVFAGSVYSALMKGKTDSYAGKLTSKVFKGNVYKIDKSWLARVGETRCSHNLYSVGVENSGVVSIEDCIFDIDELITDYQHIADNFMFNRNTIKARKISSTTAVLRFVPNVDSESILIVNDNTVRCEEPTTAGFTFISTKSTDLKLWGKLFVSKNEIYVNDSSSKGTELLRFIKAKEAHVNDNTLNGNTRFEYETCTFGSLYSSNNKYVGGVPLGNIPLGRLYVNNSSSIKEEFFSKIENIDIPVQSATVLTPRTGDTVFAVTVKLQTSSGIKELFFTFKVTYATGSHQVSFVNTLDAPVTVAVNTATENGTYIKSSATGVSTLTPTVRFFNSTSSTFFRIVGLPSTACRYSVSMDVF